MKKSIIYTCTGDSGMTSLVGGKRVAKNDIRIEAYGSVDELNSQIGLLASQPDISDVHRQLLAVTQNKLFNLGAYLATDMLNGEPAVLRGLDVADIEAIERAIDEIDASLPPLNNFVLPGGCQSAAVAHVCRTACRQSERRILSLAQTAAIDPVALKYINRLSDFMFVFARLCNIKNGAAEIFWNKDCQYQ